VAGEARAAADGAARGWDIPPNVAKVISPIIPTFSSVTASLYAMSVFDDAVETLSLARNGHSNG
jgi:hypothetical protein